jgi:NTE family protein
VQAPLLLDAGLPAARIGEIFTGLTLLDMTAMVDLAIRGKSGFVRGKKLVAFIRKHIGHAAFEDLGIPLRVVATDFWKRSPVVFRSGDVADAVRASVSIPGIFEPVSHNGRILIDGGAVNPLPCDIIRRESDIVVAIDVLGEKTPGGDAGGKPNIFEAILSTFQIMEASMVESALVAARPDILIKPRLKNIRVMEFYRAGAILEGVEADARLLKRKLKALL